MGAGPSALEVAAHYDGAGKVVVITGANSGIGAIAFHIITANPRRAELFQGKEAARVLAIRSAAAGVCVPCRLTHAPQGLHRCHVCPRQETGRRGGGRNTSCSAGSQAQRHGSRRANIASARERPIDA